MLGSWQVVKYSGRHQSVQYLYLRFIASFAQPVQFLTSCDVAAVCFDDLMA